MPNCPAACAEHVGRLKNLRYLNLALNNVVRIGGLAGQQGSRRTWRGKIDRAARAGCEALEKLDLTVNFIVDVSTAATLQANRNLTDLYVHV